MDLSFPRFDRAAELVAWPGDLAALMVGVSVRQRASQTSLVQSSLSAKTLSGASLLQSGFRAANVDPRLFAPADGAFNGPVAALVRDWKGK